jgi:hypothetical protein
MTNQDTKSSNFVYTVSIIASITSILLIIGFILSVIVNSIVFSSWNLPFLQIASPSDVLMSGLFFLFESWRFVLFIIASTLFAYFLGNNHTNYVRKMIPEKHLIIWYFILLSTSIALVFIVIQYYSKVYRDKSITSELFVIDSEDSRGNCGIKQIMWMGERSIIARCQQTGGITLIRSADNLRIGDEEELYQQLITGGGGGTSIRHRTDNGSDKKSGKP